MKTHLSLRTKVFAFIVAIVCTNLAAIAQNQRNTVNTKSPMIYHDGPIMTATPGVYFIWYGCWTNDCGQNGSVSTRTLLEDFTSNIGGSPYFAINTSYYNVFGQTPSGALLYGGSSMDPNYSHGVELTLDDIKAIVKDRIESNGLPQDPAGIYIVLASADVGSAATGLCTGVGVSPPHGNVEVFGSWANFGFVGNPKRCPQTAGPQFIARNGALLPTPNADFAGDVMASDIAHVLSTIITNPYFNGGWYDRFGLGNADKCQGTFGITFATSNGARANVTWGGRSYLIQQNWVNDKRGRCAMQLFQ
ncbi:MAG: hypothetical protein ACJ72Z_03280 [Pyrinomonadaceae bacterium]